MKRSAVLFSLFVLLVTQSAFAQAVGTKPVLYSAPKAEIDKIIEEGMNRSQVMDHIGYLTEDIGPRLTNSPNMRRASNWTRDTMAKWSLDARLEPFGPFGRGWSVQGYSISVVAPDFQPVLAYPNAWSPSTNGPQTADVVFLDTSTDTWQKDYAGKLAGKIVMISEPRELKEEFPGIYQRFDDESLAKLVTDGQTPRPPIPTGTPDMNDPRMAALGRRMAKLIGMNALIGSEKPLAVIETSPMGSQGAMMVHSATLFPPATKEAVAALPPGTTPWTKAAEPFLRPQFTMASEDYNRLARMVRKGTPVKMTVDLRATYHDEDTMGHNVIAEIPGSDPKLKDEVVMLGAHLDSWHASKGATDNAAGSGVVMEAMRILKASGLKPRRTIRVALWSGEEQGLIGSKAYVTKHFGEMKRIPGDPKASPPVPARTELVKAKDYEKLSAYFNVDNGSGKFRGLYLMGNSEIKPIFEEWLKPFHSMGAKTLTMVSRGSTDHVSFDNIGLPGFGFIQDPLNYSLTFGPRSHHTNLDNLDRILPDDMKQAATVMAAFVYQSAMIDDRLPRKPSKPATTPVAMLFDSDNHVHECGTVPFDIFPLKSRSWIADRRFESIEDILTAAN